MPIKKVSKPEIIIQSLKLFRSQGYHRTTMADIGNACGLLKGSIYHYFTSKEDLMSSVLLYLRDYYRDKVFAIAFDHSFSPKQRLALLGEKSIEVFATGGGACLMANIAMETNNVVPEFRQPIKDFFDDWVNALAEIYKTHYSKKSALFFARESVCAIEGAAMMMRIYEDKEYLLKAHAMIMEKFEKASKEALI